MTLTKRAAVAQQELFHRYDELTALWLKAEEELTKLHVPRTVCHVYADYEEDWHDPGSTVCLCLGLVKIKGKWRICHGAFQAHYAGEPDSWTPINDCSAETRVWAAKHLPGLREAVVKSAEDFVPKVDDAIKALKGALNTDINELLAERAKFNGKK
jgi:hypothetical protein